MRIKLLQDISSTKIKGSCKHYGSKDEILEAKDRNHESILVHGTKEIFILFKSDENKKYKII